MESKFANRIRIAIVNKSQSLVLALFFMLVATPESAMAGLAWDSPMDYIRGPWAAAISMIWVVIAWVLLIFGRDELGEFARLITMLVLVLSLIVAASSIISMLPH